MEDVVDSHPNHPGYVHAKDRSRSACGDVLIVSILEQLEGNGAAAAFNAERWLSVEGLGYEKEKEFMAEFFTAMMADGEIVF